MTCDHPINFQIHDEREGFIICSKCARVLDNLYISRNQDSSTHTENEYKYKTSCSLELDKLYEKNVIPKFIYEQVLTKTAQLQQEQKLIKKRFSSNELVGFALYWLLKNNNLMHSPETVSKWLDINIRKLNEIQKYMKITNSSNQNDKMQNEYDILISRYISFLSYENPKKRNYKDKSNIEAIINNLKTNHKEKCLNIRPQSLSALIIYLFYCYKFNFNPHEKSSLKDLHLICSICHVSSFHIKKLFKNHFYNLNISTLL